MDIDRVFPGAIIGKRELRSLILSYRRYGRLKDTEKTLFKNTIYSKDGKYFNQPLWSLALLIKSRLREDLSIRHFKIANRWISRGYYARLLMAFYIKHPGYIVNNQKAVYKEFLFQGFVKLENYTDKDLRDKRTKTKYDYIMSNRDILGIRFIYPKKMSNNYKLLYKRGQLNTHIKVGQDYYNKIGIPGYTCYRYANY